MPEDDAALRATLTQIVLADLQAARSPLSPPAVTALRILSSAPTTTPPRQAPTRIGRCWLRRAGVAAGFGVGVAAVAGTVFLATGSDTPRPLPQAAPTATLPADLTPVPADGGSALPDSGTPVLLGPSAITAPASVAGPEGLPVPGTPAAATTRTETIAAAPAPARTRTAAPSSQPPAPPTAGPGPSPGPTTSEPAAAEPTTPEPTTPGPEAAPSDAGPATEDATADHRAADRADGRCPPRRGDPSGQP